MGCDEINGARDIGGGLCSFPEGHPYAGFLVDQSGTVLAGPGGDANHPFVGRRMSACTTGVVLPAMSGDELQSLDASYNGPVDLYNGRGVDQAGMACLSSVQPALLSQMVTRVSESCGAGGAGLSRFSPETCTAVADAVCSRLPESGRPEACQSESPVTESENFWGSATGMALEVLGILVVISPAFTVGGRITEGAMEAFGPSLWAGLTRSSAVSTFLANSPRITTMLSRIGIRAASAAESVAAVAASSAMSVCMGFITDDMLNVFFENPYEGQVF